MTDFDLFIRGARNSAPGQGLRLGILADVARRCYRFGSVVDPDSPTVGRAIRVGAQANAALFSFAGPEGPALPFPLGEGPPVSTADTAPGAHAHAGAWTEGFQLAVISRQPSLLDRLAAVTTEQLRASPETSAPEHTFRWVDLLRALWTQPQVTADPSYAWTRRYVARCSSGSRHHREVRQLTGFFLDLLPPLDARDAAGFAAALAEALGQHRRYWSATEKRRKDSEGFVSLELAAVASLAWDRGLRFDVESDYAPSSWVRGDLFRQPTLPAPQAEMGRPHEGGR